MSSEERPSTESRRPREQNCGWTGSDADRVLAALLLATAVYSTLALAELVADPWRNLLVQMTVGLTVLGWTWLFLLTGRMLSRATRSGITSFARRVEESKRSRPLAFSTPGRPMRNRGTTNPPSPCVCSIPLAT